MFFSVSKSCWLTTFRTALFFAAEGEGEGEGEGKGEGELGEDGGEEDEVKGVRGENENWAKREGAGGLKKGGDGGEWEGMETGEVPAEGGLEPGT